MKKIILLLVIFGAFNLEGQITQIAFENFVECYYPNKNKDAISIYETPNGEKITTLNALNEEYCWYKFTVSESRNGWLKIENIMVLPSCRDHVLNKNIVKYKGKWVLAKNMKIALPDISKDSGVKMNFYAHPNEKSMVVYTAVAYLKTELLEVQGTWAKVKFVKNGQVYTGWLEKKYQCPFPWTTCPL